MRRLFIFNSNEPPTRQFRIRLFQPVLITAVFTILLLETSLRLEAVQQALPPAQLYYEPGVEEREHALEKVLAQGGQVDLLFIGSSVVRTNFRPFLFDEQVKAKTGRTIVSFNGGFSALSPDPVHLYLEHFWFPNVQPPVIFQGLRYFDLVSLVESAEYEVFQAGSIEPLWWDPSPMAQIKLFGRQNFRVFQYAGILKEILRLFPASPARGFPIDERGYNATQLTLAEAQAQGLIEDVTAFAYTEELDPQVFQFTLEVLAETQVLCAANGATYVLVNMPEHPGKFLSQPNGRSRYAFYLEQLQQFADEHGILFIDVTHGSLERFNNPDYYSDYHHMTPEGAAAFTQALAEEMVIYADELFAQASP